MSAVPHHLDELERPLLEQVAYEFMLSGLVFNRSALPHVLLHTGSLDDLNQVAIDMWMGASPVYTGRTRDLMGISGDDVEAIIRTLQLDVGFVHQYMDVGYVVHDPSNAEFWLNHCGALLDAEPHGEEQVFGMCHTIEDPTFDATALATNPKARIRPIHRPPRQPADRSPHCHWTLKIDPEHEPIGSFPTTEAVAALALATVPNPLGEAPEDDGVRDARGPFDPMQKLPQLASRTLAAMAREFQVQTHLLAASTELCLHERYGSDAAGTMMREAWAGTSTIMSERLAPLLGGTTVAERVARVLALTPAVAPGYARAVTTAGDALTLELQAEAPGLDDPAHPGFVGLCASGVESGFVAMVRGVDPSAAVEVRPHRPGHVVVDITCGAAEPQPESDTVAMMRVGSLTSWDFDLGEASVAFPSRR